MRADAAGRPNGVVKSDGLPTYLLADIAYHRKKLARGFDDLCA